MAKVQEAGLTVRIISPFTTYYEGPAVSVTALNETGPFDILLNHAKFFSVLQSGEVVVNTGADIQRFDIERGIIRVADNVVTLFANV